MIFSQPSSVGIRGLYYDIGKLILNVILIKTATWSYWSDLFTIHWDSQSVERNGKRFISIDNKVSTLYLDSLFPI